MSITIRAVGQASRRGATHRVPNAAALLASVDEWLVDAARDTMRRHTLGDRTTDGAIEVSLHPAARPVLIEATDAGVMTVQAMTIPVGPGYHTYVAELLRRLGQDVGLTWKPTTDPDGSSDPTGAFPAGDRSHAERAHLGWLHSSIMAIRDARRQEASGLHLATPVGVRYTFDGAVATVLGPRDDAWVELAVGDPRTAADVWPWAADAMDARYHLGRALTLLWTEVRWRPPVGTPEVGVLDDVLATLRFAYPLEPGLPWPWAAWREAFALRGHNDPSTHQLLQRAASVEVAATGAEGSASVVGYRRNPVTVVQAGWGIDLPGSFTERRTADEWSGSDAGRTVTFAAAETASDGAPMSPMAFLQQVAAGLGPDAIEHAGGAVRGRARISTDSSTGVEVATLDGFSAVTGSGAAVRIEFDDPNDWKWAIDTWRGLRPV